MTETSTEDQPEPAVKYPTVDKEYLDLDLELSVYKLGKVDIIIHDWAEGTDVYTTAGTTRSVTEAVKHDGPAIKDGHFREFHAYTDTSLPVSSHPMAGRRNHFRSDEKFDEEIVLLRELDRVPINPKNEAYQKHRTTKQ